MAAHADALEPKQARSRATRERLLDAAVKELMESGYSGLTTQAVAASAGVSRGAAQNHFPQRSILFAEAVQHLGQLQVAELRRTFEQVPGGKERLRVALDVIFDQYSSGHFAAILELSLAARQDAELHPLVAAEERAIASELNGIANDLFGSDAKRIGPRWATALATVRGLALLKHLGHSVASVDRQWRSTRNDLLDLLTQPRARGN